MSHATVLHNLLRSYVLAARNANHIAMKFERAYMAASARCMRRQRNHYMKQARELLVDIKIELSH